MKKLLVLIACAYAISMNAMDEKAFIHTDTVNDYLYAHIKNCIINILPSNNSKKAELSAEPCAELIELIEQRRFQTLNNYRQKATYINGRICLTPESRQALHEAAQELEKLSALEQLLDPTKKPKDYSNKIINYKYNS